MAHVGKQLAPPLLGLGLLLAACHPTGAETISDLDVVATTLETLAQGQRMVGVVTHVAALAERVPVRFKVSRDARTSSVRRESLTDEAAAI